MVRPCSLGPAGILNHGDEAAAVTVTSPLRDLITGERVGEAFSLPSRKWRILLQKMISP